MSIVLTDLSHPGVAPYLNLTDRRLRRAVSDGNPEGIFIAESPKVIRMALDAGLLPLSMLCENRHITGDAAPIIAACPEMPVYTGPRDLLETLTGYTLTRGVLCAFRRPSLPSLEDVAANARLLCIIHDVCDATNVGAIFRSAAALGVDAVVMGGSACDPLNRRAIRVSMGTVFRIPWTACTEPVAPLQQLGFTVAALALRPDAIPLSDPALRKYPKMALILGTEGEGLPDNVINRADLSVIIPMAPGIDSLNVAAASAVAFWALH